MTGGGMFGNPKPPGSLSLAMNALLPAPAPPTLEQEIQRLVATHGKDAVRAMVRELTKSKRGRRAEKDWPLLAPIIRHDAELWLQGQNPTQKPRTNYAIASIVSKHHPGHSQAATHRRIMGKLKEKRRLFMLIFAFEMGRSNYPFAAYIRTLEELERLDRHRVWSGMASSAKATVERYRERHGEPKPELTFAEVEQASRTSNALGGLTQFLGIDGAVGQLPSYRAE